MIGCFGLGWPIAAFKTWRAKRVDGKSLGFILLVFTGYLAGITMKFIEADGSIPDWVIGFYLFNIFFVTVEIVLYLKFRPGRIISQDE